MAVYLTKEEILQINREMVLRFGGLFISENDNVINMNSFEYLLEIVKSDISGCPLYPSIFTKAAAYAFHVIKDHIFYDGSKRTGVEAAFLFLEKNGIFLRESLTDDEIVNLGLSIEEGALDIDDIAKWLEDHSRTHI